MIDLDKMDGLEKMSAEEVDVFSRVATALNSAAVEALLVAGVTPVRVTDIITLHCMMLSHALVKGKCETMPLETVEIMLAMANTMIVKNLELNGFLWKQKPNKH